MKTTDMEEKSTAYLLSAVLLEDRGGGGGGGGGGAGLTGRRSGRWRGHGAGAGGDDLRAWKTELPLQARRACSSDVHHICLHFELLHPKERLRRLTGDAGEQ